ncbi:hypothetical protein ABT008_05685 [Micromonospora sp. NPDC002389]|uniref:hypothetical protein n=1 Tax=Micromonospora sp. NPDC002389 TaxID=3154272 RepID=UPI003326C1EE
MSREHVPSRPLWRCRACGAHWPCGPAKLALLREYAGHTLALVFYLAHSMRDAVDDIVMLGFTPDLAALNNRFMRWVNQPIDLNEGAPHGRATSCWPGRTGISPLVRSGRERRR